MMSTVDPIIAIRGEGCANCGGTTQSGLSVGTILAERDVWVPPAFCVGGVFAWYDLEQKKVWVRECCDVAYTFCPHCCWLVVHPITPNSIGWSGFASV